METSTTMPEILIPASPPPNGAGPAPLGGASADPAVRPDKTPGQAGDEKSFSSTINELDQDQTVRDVPETRATPPDKATDNTSPAPVTPVDPRMDLAAETLEPGILALEPAADTANDAGKLLPPGGEALPDPAAPGSTLPASDAAAKPVTPLALQTVATSIEPTAAAQPGLSGPQSAPAIAPATTSPELSLVTNNAASVAPGFTDLPARLAQAANPLGQPQRSGLLPPSENPAGEAKAMPEVQVQSLRMVLLQATPAEGLRIAMPQASDTALLAPLSQFSANPGAAFTDALATLGNGSGQPVLQPTGDGQVFAKGLGERLMMMADNGLQTARIKLYPEHLGPLDIKVQIDDDVAKVWFNAQHGQTREALEQALPRLRDMFAEQGLQLVRSEVNDGSGEFGEQFAQADEADNASHTGTDDARLADVDAAAMTLPLHLGGGRLLDVRA